MLKTKLTFAILLFSVLGTECKKKFGEYCGDEESFLEECEPGLVCKEKVMNQFYCEEAVQTEHEGICGGWFYKGFL